jgi:hypothetical protein
VSGARANLTRVLKDMLSTDGYEAVIESWPQGDQGHARIRIVARAHACVDCLVAKDVMRLVLANELPAGIELDPTDLLYPHDA